MGNTHTIPSTFNEKNNYLTIFIKYDTIA